MNFVTTPIKRLHLSLVAIIAAVAMLGAFAGSAAANPDTPCRIELTPETADNPLNTAHTVTATVVRKGGDMENWPASSKCKTDGSHGGPLAGIPVRFTIISGPNAGLATDVLTDANGQASYSWWGATPGTDVVRASITFDYVEINDPNYGCEQGQGAPYQGNTQVSHLGNLIVCTSTYYDDAVKNWVCVVNCTPPPPPPPVTPSVNPKVTIKVSKKCVKRTLVVRSRNSGSYKVRLSVLYIDGKRVKRNRTGTFKIRTGRYSKRTHRIKVVTKFSNGTKITKTGKFKLCKSRLTSRRTNPRFTG